MANRVRTQTATEPRVSKQEKETNPLERIIAIYEENQNIINWVTGSIVALVAIFLIYKYMYKIPTEEKASSSIFYPQLYFQADSMNLALNGDGKHKGFSKISKSFGGTDAANLSNLYEGLAYLKMGDYNKAIKSLGEFDGRGTLLAYQAWGALGSAYMETGNKKKAIEYYKKASGDNKDILLTPLYLYELGMAYEANNQPNDAKAAYKRIRDEFPKSMQARDIDKALAKLGEIE